MKAHILSWIFTVSVLTSAPAQSRFTYSTSFAAANVRPLPATPSLATGVAEIVVDVFPNFTTMGWTVRWSNLTGLPVTANVHGPADAGGSAPAWFALGNFFSDSTPASGAYSGFRQVSDPVQIAAIRDGMGYISIRTPAFPTGEIRAQLVAVPEPTTHFLAAAGALMLQIQKRARGRLSRSCEKAQPTPTAPPTEAA